MEALRLYGKFVAIAIRSRMQYRSDFFTGIIGVIFLSTVNLSLVAILVGRFRSLQGWTLWEIALLYGMWLLSHSIQSLFFWHLSTLEEDILHGRLDQYLIRPCSPLLQFLGREVNYVGVGDVLFGSAAFSLAYTRLGLHWSARQWAFFVLAILSGAVIENCIVWIISSLSFWTGRSRGLLGLILQVNWLTPQYPMEIFGYGFRIFITAFLPFAFMNYYPLTVLLGKSNALGVGWIAYLSPAVAAVLLVVGATVWRRGLAAYTSAGN
jgi:ABC-2 type transport system permease protein